MQWVGGARGVGGGGSRGGGVGGWVRIELYLRHHVGDDGYVTMGWEWGLESRTVPWVSFGRWLGGVGLGDGWNVERGGVGTLNCT